MQLVGGSGLSGVFLSYSRGDRALALQILQNLRALGVDVWWDEDMPGVDWQEELARQISDLGAVLVLWTPLSTASKNVRDEARLGQNTEKLVNVMFGVAAPPFPFERLNGLPLDGWTGRETHNGWTRVIRTIEERLVAAGGAKPGELTGALQRRERSIEDRRKQVLEAETAFADAQTAEADSSAALDSARAEFAAAEAQLRSVIDMQAGARLLKAAQEQLDAALAARTDAEQARRSASASLTAASKSLASAKAELERLFGDGHPAREVVSAAPAVMPTRGAPTAATPQRPARSAAAAGARSAGLPRDIPWRPLAAVAGAVIAVIGVGTLALRAGNAPPAPPPASSVRATEAVAREGAPPSAPAPPPPTLPSRLLGAWDVGLGCSNPVTFSDDHSTLSRSFAGETVRVTLRKVSAGSAQVSAADGSHYELRGDGSVWLTPAGGKSMELTKCSG